MVNIDSGQWLNQPEQWEIRGKKLVFQTQPGTDLWQRSYYGFRNDNAPCYMFQKDSNFTFTAKATFNYTKQFDQCGLIIYVDSDNWFKASIEFETTDFSRLGSVVTNNGYSDWATVDIALPNSIYYRLSRRGPDFLIEYSFDGKEYKQMRVFHLHQLGATTIEMGKAQPPLPANSPVSFGVYACSPLNSSFVAEFSEMQVEDCIWAAHEV